MKNGKSPGPSGLIIDMIKASGISFLDELTVLINPIIYEGKVSSDWNLSYIINLYRLKRTDHAIIRWKCGVERMQPHFTSDLKSK